MASKIARATGGRGAGKPSGAPGGAAKPTTAGMLMPSDDPKWIADMARSFDSGIIAKMGRECYDRDFSPAMACAMKKGLDYDEIKRRVDMPAKRGASIPLEKFGSLREPCKR